MFIRQLFEILDLDWSIMHSTVKYFFYKDDKLNNCPTHLISFIALHLFHVSFVTPCLRYSQIINNKNI